MSKAATSMEEALINLQELGFRINEYKGSGGEHIHISDYEKLLDFAIDALTVIKDTIAKD